LDYSGAIDDWIARNRGFQDRVLTVVDGLDETGMNRRPDPRTWSPAQVIEHLTLGNAPYLKLIDTALQRAHRGGGKVRYSFFGQLIARGTGPGGVAPVPKSMIPRKIPIPLGVIAEWREQQERLEALLEQARGKDLSRTGVRNPFFPIIRMNLADCFEILTSHTDGHVQQIEQRVFKTAPET
jgi:hypothetical protein